MPPRVPLDNSLVSRMVQKGRRADNSTSGDGCGSSDSSDPTTNISRRGICPGGNNGQTASSVGHDSTTGSSTTIITTITSTNTISTSSIVTVTTTEDTATTTSIFGTRSIELPIQSSVNSLVVQSTEPSDSETVTSEMTVTSGSFAATSSPLSSSPFTSSDSSLDSSSDSSSGSPSDSSSGSPSSSSSLQNLVFTSSTSSSSFATSPPGTSAFAFGVSTDLPQSTASSSDSGTTSSSSSSRSPLGAIAGSIAGAIALWLCFAFYCYCRRRRRRFSERTGSMEYLSPRGHVTRPSDTSFFTSQLRQTTPTPRPQVVIQTTELNNDTVLSNPFADPISAITPASDIHVYTDAILLPSPTAEHAASPEPSEPDSDAYYSIYSEPQVLAI